VLCTNARGECLFKRLEKLRKSKRREEYPKDEGELLREGPMYEELRR